MTPRELLLDADGVVQHNPRGWLDDVRAFVEPARGDEFVADIFATESAAMTGERDFEDVVAEVAGRWDAAHRSAELLAHWCRIEVAAATVALVHELRASGVRCYLATNQNSYRAAYMKRALGYGQVFDGAFYSCDLGVLKSSPEFFDRVVDRLDVSAPEVLFVDDKEEYVDVARAAGLQAETWSIDHGVQDLRQRLSTWGLPL